MTFGTWVPAFDQSFQRVPIANYPSMYADGYRVMLGYVAGGTSGKWITQAEIEAWLAQGSDTGFGPLFEAKGTEPVDSPGSGTAHAKAARAGCRARGVPDGVVISPAMDENITVAQGSGPVAQYMKAWKDADTVPPLPYIELDVGAALVSAGLAVGVGVPAAYTWGPPNKLVTPANASSSVLWTQEHNGQNLHGGNVDIGHVRTDAPILWSDADMVLSPDDIKAIWAYKAPDGETAIGKLQDIYLRAGSAANTQLPALAAAVSGLTAKQFAAAIVAALPPLTGQNGNGITVEQLHAELAKLHLDLTA